jgi:hypothetical protein
MAAPGLVSPSGLALGRFTPWTGSTPEGHSWRPRPGRLLGAGGMTWGSGESMARWTTRTCPSTIRGPSPAGGGPALPGWSWPVGGVGRSGESSAGLASRGPGPSRRNPGRIRGHRAEKCANERPSGAMILGDGFPFGHDQSTRVGRRDPGGPDGGVDGLGSLFSRGWRPVIGFVSEERPRGVGFDFRRRVLFNCWLRSSPSVPKGRDLRGAIGSFRGGRMGLFRRGRATWTLHAGPDDGRDRVTGGDRPDWVRFSRHQSPGTSP